MIISPVVEEEKNRQRQFNRIQTEEGFLEEPRSYIGICSYKFHAVPDLCKYVGC